MRKKAPTPTPSLNGTNRDELVRQKLGAHRAVKDAEDMLVRAAPHGRDYQTMPNGDILFHEAQQIHAERVRALNDLAERLMEEAIAVRDAPGRSGGEG